MTLQYNVSSKQQHNNNALHVKKCSPVIFVSRRMTRVLAGSRFSLQKRNVCSPFRQGMLISKPTYSFRIGRFRGEPNQKPAFNPAYVSHRTGAILDLSNRDAP